jgi:1-acyl-sn-glycerol-3-phosphate acyltransferase
MRTYLLALILPIYTAVVGGPLLLFALLTGRAGALYKAGVAGARLALWAAGARIEALGRERIPRGRAAVYMANHQSISDPPAVLSLLPPVLVLVKKEFFRVPFLGLAMRLRGFIPIDRQNREQAMAALELVVAKLRAGHSFLVYPEGTRSPDGHLQPFKKGVFRMVAEAGVPIVPISVSGSTKILRKGERRVHPGTIRIVIHDPIPTEGLRTEDLDGLMAKVRAAITSELAADERPVESGLAQGESE